MFRSVLRTTVFFISSACLGSIAWAYEPLPAQPAVPADNPMSAAKVELGKQLYFDPRLSIDGTLSCNSCHNVMGSGTDNRPVSVGVAAQKGGRSAPTVWNSAFLSSQFWDGRAATLEDQAKGPILNPIEMGMHNEQQVLDRLTQIPGYVTQFKAVFGGDKSLSYDNVARAIAAYERTLITPNSAFDRHLKGDRKAMSEQARRGMETFQEVGCTACHSGPNFSGPANLPMGDVFAQRFPTFQDNAYVEKYGFMKDPGRFEATRNDADKHMWRVPSLRNIAVTGPYFHNGAVATLDEAVRVMARTQLDKDLSDAQTSDIVAFLGSLTGEFPAQSLPQLPDPGVTFFKE